MDLLLDDPALERALLLALNADTGLATLRTIALACNANWDLVQERMGPEPDPPPLALDELLADLHDLCALASSCVDAEDKLAEGLVLLAAWSDRLEHAPDEYEQLRLLTEGLPKFSARSGRKGNWPSTCDVETVRAAVAAARRRPRRSPRPSPRPPSGAWRGRSPSSRCARPTSAAGAASSNSTTCSCSLARCCAIRATAGTFGAGSAPATRTSCSTSSKTPIPSSATSPRCSHPATRTRATGAGTRSRSIPDVCSSSVTRSSRSTGSAAPTSPRSCARSAFGATPRHLTRNYRTTRQVIEFVNHVFRDLIVAEPESQPEYVALVPNRGDAPIRPGPVLLGVSPHDDGARADTLREREAADVAAAVTTALTEGWSVSRPGTGGTEVWEPCRLGDIAILLPARTSLGQLEDALDAAGIPYRAETSSLVYGTREIRDLLQVLQAVDDPTDELSLVSALRSPLLGCGDDDLYTFRVDHRGHWNHQAPLPESLPHDHPVADAMRAVAAWHDARLWLGPSELLDRIVRERRVLEVAFAHGRPRDLWRRVRFVIDQARAFSEASGSAPGHRAGGGLRDFLRWADLQSAEGARVVETVLPETDDDAVRILTIHGAKGLEFPITIVSGMTTGVRRRRTGVQLLFPHDSATYALRVSKRVTTEEFERYEPIDEQMDFHEKLRLLYVALTRARDHLVVSVHRPARVPDAEDRTKWTHAELLWAAASEAPHWTELAPVAGGVPATTEPTAPADPVPGVARLGRATRPRARNGVAPRVWSATAIATVAAERADPGLAKDARDLELPPWNKGRYGTAVGSAVHAVLQTVDLVTGHDVDETAAAQAAAEGVIGRERDIAALTRSALASHTVREAVATNDYRREMYVATQVEGHTLEGYVDLVYRTNDGLVVVDYKTDAWRDESDLDAKVARYRLQGASYALALEAATGEPVARCVFVFLGTDGVDEREVSDLPRAMDQVRALLSASAGSE